MGGRMRCGENALRGRDPFVKGSPPPRPLPLKPLMLEQFHFEIALTAASESVCAPAGIDILRQGNKL
ncbi:hypothetical protein KL86DES1_20388 [uncultured Desulfovibrio sp.]|uniref:Uncharacterized protein n=1 Tax=uncultured Desulfovibrio sp. TaxID=167968 RepID=A0A212L3J4_9BACT|nr:hypothetical protein KL86DES1_20388 [uncultured Desulfovibrio sp.]VZH33291.1 conserved protein of unknown function [Desulfovibrio sp. 86]